MLKRPALDSILLRSPSGMDLRVQVHPGVDAIAQADWKRLFPGDPESWSYYRSGDQAPPPGFSLGAISVRYEDRIVAAATLFRTVYRFDTSFQGRMRRIGDWLYKRAPALVSMRVMGLGSPLTDHCHIGFHPDLTAQQRDEVLTALLDGLSAQAKREKVPLLAAKALTSVQSEALEPVFKQRAFTRVTSIPVVMLSLPFRNEARYFSSLPPRTASYLRRKFRPLEKLRIEYRTSIAGLEEEINTLYRATLAQSPVDYGEFGHVHEEHFSKVLANMGDKAQVMLTWLDGELLSFQLFVVTYHTKMLFGGVIEKRWIHFRFRNPIRNAILPWLAPAFDFEKNDPELQAMATQQAQAEQSAKGKEQSKAQNQAKNKAKHNQA
jgi:Acetyltransferase (GNAT) domain